MNQSNDRTCAALLSELQALDFCLTETNLYLDAYPTCGEALAYYRRLSEERARLAAQYVRLCGPLTAADAAGNGTWQWTQTPWPWELAANNG